MTRPTGVQFGHAGASASGEKETASAKNRALREAGAIVPDNFDLLGVKIGEVYGALVKKGDIVPQPETPPPPGLVTYDSFSLKLIQNIPLIEAEISLVLSFHKLSSLCLVQSEGLFGRLRAPFTLIDGTKKKETLSCDSAGHFTGDALVLLS